MYGNTETLEPFDINSRFFDPPPPIVVIYSADRHNIKNFTEANVEIWSNDLTVGCSFRQKLQVKSLPLGVRGPVGKSWIRHC